MDINSGITLIVKVQQFEDRRVQAKASWNIKELKGKLSEIYDSTTEEQKLIYSGKLLNDKETLKDVLRQYDGQEAHTVHLVFTPKSGSRNSKYYETKQPVRQPPPAPSTMQTPETTSSGIRQRHTVTATSVPVQAEVPNAQPHQAQNIPNAFYPTSGPTDAQSLLAQQYAMQNWMQQAYSQYMNQYMNMMSPEGLYNMQQQQQSQQPPNLAFMQMPFNQMPFVPAAAPNIPVITSSTASVLNAASSPIDTEAPGANQVPQVPAAQPEAPAQRRFPNIIQDAEEHRDWLDILYSMSRLMILLCLVYFYSSPVRCLVVILIGVAIYLYHIYKQNQNRLNNNNSTRVNNNLVPPQAAAPVVQQPVAPPAQNEENIDRHNAENIETEPLVAPPAAEPIVNEASTESSNEQVEEINNQGNIVALLRTFVLSFFASIIPEAPAL
ncbi:unnamed protein product [Diamesa serratosioi]